MITMAIDASSKSTGVAIFKDEKGDETTALSYEEIRKILASDAATNYAEEVAEKEAADLEDLARVNPLMADFIENANGTW